MSGEIIPFGKYKDKPIELMASDRQYVDWLIQQPWFKEKYGNIYNVVINYQAEPTETPEHNKMQILFLDKDFTHKFVMHIGGKVDAYKEVEFEKRLIDWKGNRERSEPRIITPPVDVVIGYRQCQHIYSKNDGHPDLCSWTAAIEIKPTVGDDFPAVLRQMKESRATDLLIGEYTGEVATVEQLRAFFKTAGIRVTFMCELEAEIGGTSGNR